MFYLILNSIDSHELLQDYFDKRDTYYGYILGFLIAALSIAFIFIFLKSCNWNN